MFEKVILVTRKTRLEELIVRYGSERQARFQIEHGGGNFQQYSEEHTKYKAAYEKVRPVLTSLDNLRLQMMDRELVKSYLFAKTDLIVTLGQDGLVANTAKYVGNQPIIAINPDPQLYDGVLLPFLPEDIKDIIQKVLADKFSIRKVTLGEAKLADGQSLLAFNDFFIGTKSHTSARYLLSFDSHQEIQSSSGIIVSTGAGSTGWMSSIFNMASSINLACGGHEGIFPKMHWDETRLLFAVREPFISKASTAGITFGVIDSAKKLVLESMMPNDGVIFSDGVEADYVSFNSGARVAIRPASQKAHLIEKN